MPTYGNPRKNDAPRGSRSASGARRTGSHVSDRFAPHEGARYSGRPSSGRAPSRHSDPQDHRGRSARIGRRDARDANGVSPSGEKRGANPAKPLKNPPEAALVRMWRYSKKLTIALIIIVVLLAVGLMDALMNGNRIYAGVRIGDVDVAGMTAEEAASALADRYDASIQTSTAYVFPTQESADASDIEANRYVNAADGASYSLEDAQGKSLLWIENAQNTGAQLATEKMTQEALSIGKDGRFWERISAAIGGHDIPIELDFNSGAIETLLSSVNSAIGTPMVNYNIALDEGVATVTEGHNGNLVSADSMEADLTQALLHGKDTKASFVAQPEQVLVQIDERSAEDTATVVTDAISTGASFIFDNENIPLDKAELGAWISTEVMQNEKGGYYLNPLVNVGAASLDLIPRLGFSLEDDSIPATFSQSDKQQIVVNLKQEELLPGIDDALATLDKGLFNAFRERAMKDEKPPKSDSQSSAVQSSANVFGIPVDMVMQSGPFNFDEAMALGVITEISSYSTWFYNTEETKNRFHNIQLAASLIDDSIIPADGGQWSWFETAGACAEEDGFLPAGAIAADELLQEAGGGICQVATTVFNCVYDGGYNILERHSHTLYMSMYPDGRDAAVTYPSLDLKWQNDTTSDVLLKTKVDDGSVTVTLYGVSPHYTVTTEVGEWEEGDDFEIEVKKEGDHLELDESEVETEGVKGSSITVKRIVRNQNGDIVYADTFESSYYPVTEIIMVHPDTTLDTKKVIEEEEKRLEEEAKKEGDKKNV